MLKWFRGLIGEKQVEQSTYEFPTSDGLVMKYDAARGEVKCMNRKGNDAKSGD